MDDFFRPPPKPPHEQVPFENSPPWTGRPDGPPRGEVVSDLLIGSSESTTVSIAYIDAYPSGFELEISAVTSVPYHTLERAGDDSGPDPFGRHWPMAGERRSVLPPQLLRVGVRFSDGRTATSIAGHGRPLAGPVISELRGGGSTRRGGSRFRQGYWISPLPPPGVFAVVCEWPAVNLPVVSVDLDAQLLIDAAARAATEYPASRPRRG